MKLQVSFTYSLPDGAFIVPPFNVSKFYLRNGVFATLSSVRRRYIYWDYSCISNLVIKQV